MKNAGRGLSPHTDLCSLSDSKSPRHNLSVSRRFGRRFGRRFSRKNESRRRVTKVSRRSSSGKSVWKDGLEKESGRESNSVKLESEVDL